MDQNHAQLAQFLMSILKVEDGDAEDATLPSSVAEELSIENFLLDLTVQEVKDRPSRGKVQRPSRGKIPLLECVVACLVEIPRPRLPLKCVAAFSVAIPWPRPPSAHWRISMLLEAGLELSPSTSGIMAASHR